ncbi:tyrosine-sulfated glycopeptide receptor 1 [Malania oleifera]|uniref:tyrosine-sulfated glycopeptide receptor 1 n=1 Tax=Malania oleifera TaxID=397392 RepID=UPI0025ADFDE3|nr:tyrosine-sulfated glycopeptide receptor 1 [Malania oleifera]
MFHFIFPHVHITRTLSLLYPSLSLSSLCVSFVDCKCNLQTPHPPCTSSSALLLLLRLLLVQRRAMLVSHHRRRLLLFLHLLLSCFACQACNQLDRDSLISFYLNVSSPSAAPLGWSAVDCCLWEGVSCNQDGWVTRLWLPSRGLVGGISSSLGNLSRLSQLNLSHNHLSGPLPSQLFSPFNRLEVLDLSFNRLNGELPSSSPVYSGPIPLQTANFSGNHFFGTVRVLSSFLRLALNLTHLDLSNNSFTGSIPSDLCITSPILKLLDFSFNKFSGDVPGGLGRCSRLEALRAGFNSLTDLLPADIYSLADLREISFPDNGLSGPIGDGIVNLTNLTVLVLYSNKLSGKLPQNFGMLLNLQELLLHMNNLSGPLPPSLMNCVNLMTLNLRLNSFEGDLSGLNFSNLLQLSTIDLGNNNFIGALPSTLFTCKSLTAVRLANNQLEGEISPDILALQSLSYLSLSYNKLVNITGAIKTLAGLKNLTTIMLSCNFMGEDMPDDENTVEANGFPNLQALGLGGCQFHGQLPPWLQKLRKLQVLDLSINQIAGSIPGWLGTLPSLFYIDLSDNLLSGGFPMELTGLPALILNQGATEADESNLELPVFAMPNNATKQQYNQLSNLPPAIYLRNNSLSGTIPVEIGQLRSLHVLDLSRNNFSGEIPDQISNLTNLEKLDLSDNNLSGEIPVSLRNLHFLSSFSVANNSLQGTIPLGGQFDTFPYSSFEGNPGLCGASLQQHCPNQPGVQTRFDPSVSSQNPKKKLLVGLTVGICFGIGFVLTILALCIASKRRILPRGDSDKVDLDTFDPGVPPEIGNDASLVILFPGNSNEIKELTISEILKATDNFNQANIIGCGGFGLVYKATLADGTKLAVKKLSGDLGLMDREFRAEVEALSTAQHKNLVSLQGYCVHEGFRLLLYSYMENGSLDYWLHEKSDGASQLDWPTRLRIAKGASCGLAYMHLVCEPHIVHRDIKSSNILLDDNFEAHVADFGLSRLILPYETHVTTELVGTLGYIPPEYGQAWVATLRGDVYSFGVVMLELLTGKRPVLVFMPKMSRELVVWVQKMRREGKHDEIFDPLLRGKGFEEEMLQVLDLACRCINENPFKRPAIREVVDWLKNVGLNSHIQK